jgi:uncharacterized repeat protein (TIGR01451 family)
VRDTIPKKSVQYKIKSIVNRMKQNTAVSEIVGEILMLLIVISTFGVIFYNVSSFIPSPNDLPNVTIVSRIEGNDLVLEHQRGDPLSLDTKITVHMGNDMNKTFLVKDYLDNSSKEDGVWNIGENVLYPFPYNLSNIRSYFATYINTADIESNSLVFYATLDVYPEADLGITITADNLSPAIGSMVNFTICVTNPKGGAPAKNIEVLNILSKNFSYFSNITSSGFYNSNTGIWSIPSLQNGESTCLIITAIAVLSSVPTQMVMILDGSGSISSGDWSIMKEGLASSIENSSVFPHDGNVELTVIQFGGTKAQVELAPTTVTKSNYATIGTKIRGIHQLGGTTPMSCGIRLAADQLRNIGMFDASKRQIINLVTDGVANCYWTSGYTGVYQGWDGWIKGDDQAHTGTSSAKSTSNRDGRFTCDDLNTTGATSITVDFWYRLHSTNSNNTKLYFFDGSSYYSIASFGSGTKDTWRHYTKTLLWSIPSDKKYFKNNFQIRFDTTNINSGGQVWIDDVRITTNTQEVLNDSFESDYWAKNWWNPGLKSAEEAQSYLVSTLQMTANQDDFNALGVGVGGMYGGPDVDWLINNIVWPQPGHIAPPYIPGWVKTIISWQEFEKTISEIFASYFGFSNINNVVIISATPYTDPYPENNVANIVLTPR